MKRQASLRFSWWNFVTVLASAVAVVLSANPIRAELTEVRDYSILVDGKSAGRGQLVITDKNDGTTIVANRADARVKVFFLFTFSYNGTEIWRADQLLRVDGQGKQNRKTYNVSAVLDNANGALRLRVNGREKFVAPEAWTSSFWKLPQSGRAQAVTVLKTSHGEVFQCQLKYIATEKRAVAGQNQTCYHFRLVSPKKNVDLWFDVYHRLVRQEFVEVGHRTIVELANVRRFKSKSGGNGRQPLGGAQQ